MEKRDWKDEGKDGRKNIQREEDCGILASWSRGSEERPTLMMYKWSINV